MISVSVSNIFKTILIFTTLCQGRINESEYQRMPDLYLFDDYNECVNLENTDFNYPAKYCMIFVKIQANTNSLLWQQIEEYSQAYKFNYRHDHLFRGVCLKNCDGFKKMAENKTNFDKGLLVNEQTKKFEQFHNSPLDQFVRAEFQQVIHECVNQEYQMKYNLSTKTFVKYCVDPKQRKEKDIYFKLTILLIILLIVLNIISSLYDAKLKSKQDDQHKYYEVNHRDNVSRCLTAFSVYRNYKRLIVPIKNDIGKDLGFLDGFRAILAFLIICEHSGLIQHMPLQNPGIVENLYHQLWTILFLHTFVWLELFFVLSGLFLYVKFEKARCITPQSSIMDCLNVYVRLLVSRYLRLLPSLIIAILFTANISYFAEHGPFTRSVMDSICLDCRERWWQNLLMINNFYIKSSCLLHTWYIAADFQLYAFYLLILIIVAKYPKCKLFAAISISISALLITVLVNYFLKLESIAIVLPPESYRYFYLDKIKTAVYLYFTPYANLNSFLVGIICGTVYMKYIHQKPENKKALGNNLKYSSYLGWTSIGCILYLGTKIFPNTKTTIWTAMYGLLQRHLGISIVAVITIIKGMCSGRGMLLNSKFFRLLARISFQVYLWQLIILMHLMAYFEHPLNFNMFLVVLIMTFLYVASNLIGFVAALFVEYPMAEIIGLFNIEKNLKVIRNASEKKHNGTMSTLSENKNITNLPNILK